MALFGDSGVLLPLSVAYLTSKLLVHGRQRGARGVAADETAEQAEGRTAREFK